LRFAEKFEFEANPAGWPSARSSGGQQSIKKIDVIIRLPRKIIDHSEIFYILKLSDFK
jgi:hypothetical protein